MLLHHSLQPGRLPHQTNPSKIPVGGASGQYTVDWGDGTTTDAVTGDATHIYTDAGTYTVSISGDFKRIYSYSDRSNAQKLQSVEQWGDIQWSS